MFKEGSARSNDRSCVFLLWYSGMLIFTYSRRYKGGANKNGDKLTGRQAIYRTRSESWNVKERVAGRPACCRLAGHN